MAQTISQPSIILTADDSYREQWPLAPIDDHMIHQTPDPIRVMSTSDARAFERYWVTCQDKVGELLMVLGGGFYPSLDTAEAYAIVNYQGQHTSVRGFRRIGADRMNLHIGPLKPTILQGLRTWRYVLEENEWGVSFDFLWHDTKRQVFHGPAGGLGGFSRLQASYPGPSAVPSSYAGVSAGFEGFGVAEGWVKVGNKRIELTTDTFHGTRDRHWGARDGVGGPPHLVVPRSRLVGPIGAGGGQWVEFKDWAMFGGRVLYPFGDPREARVLKMERKLRFEPDTHIFTDGIITNTLDTGEVKEFHFKRLNHQIAFLRCGMYDGTPDKNIWHGMYVGDDVVEGETYDVTKAEVRAKIIGNDVHQCLMTCEGEVVSCAFEPHEPGAYEFCRDGVPGWSLLP